ncbi:SafA/ExsA family spore coat assembly protein, partial [Peribacillus simplex]|uniref:SafA/ExsA family spore coat assembly protein n=1 Tax=Peribacillus simplex TaxID=1478 RepID=UPI003D266F56
MKIHIVQKGDTLWKLAKKYGVSFEELKKVNAQLSNPDMMMPGMKIKIPGTSGAVIKEKATPNVNIQPGMKESQVQPYQAQPALMKEQPIMQKQPVKEQPVKEQPKFQQPVKEQPKIQQPVKEQPKFQQPVKEQPKFQQPVKKEQPKFQQPVKKEQQIVQPKPIKEKEMIVPKEVPVPMPVIPEVDINNYYMVNMTNMSVQKPPAPPPLPKKKEEPAVTKKKKKKPAVQPVQEEPVDDCIPVTPIMPGSGYCIQPPPWAHMHMQGMQAPYQDAQGYQAAQEPQGYYMMEESSDFWEESPDMQTMGQGFVQGASMNPPSQQHYPYQASAPVPHHFYGGMNQQAQVAGSYMQQDYESPAESPSSYNNNNYPQQYAQTAGEEDCGCNKGLLGTYGPEVKGQYQANKKMDSNPKLHPDYHQYQSVQSQQQHQGQYPGVPAKESQMGKEMQYQYESESAESPQAQPYEGFMMMGGQNGGQPGMMMGGQNGGPPGMMMGGQNGGQPGMMMG